MEPLIIRADANRKIGLGHLMRCLALAQRWQERDGKALFVMDREGQTLEERLLMEGMEVHYLDLGAQPGSIDDALEIADIARRTGAKWVVADGYHFGSKYQECIKNFDLRLLLIDDYGHSDHYFADLVLNQNININEGLYKSRERYTCILVGTGYVLLRREFLKWRGWKRRIPTLACKILVTMGGSDPDNVTLKVILALQKMQVKALEAIVLIGGTNPHYEELQSVVQKSQIPIHLKRHVSNVAEIMAWAEIAISGGGSTCWELAFMGVPAVLVILAENQEEIVKGLEETEAAMNCGWFNRLSGSRIAESVKRLIIDKKRRANYSVRARRLVDGLGAERVLDQMVAL